MYKKHAHIHVGHYQNVFKSAPYPIAIAMLCCCRVHESMTNYMLGIPVM